MLRRLDKIPTKLLLTVPVILLIAIVGLTKIRQQPSLVEASWAPTASDWLKRKQLTLINNSGQTLITNTTYSIVLNTKSLVDSGYLQSGCQDIRLFYQPDDSTAQQLNHYAEFSPGNTCATSETTTFYFPLPSDLANNTPNGNYYLYYDNPEAEDISSISAFDVGDKQATLYCGFKSSTDCINQLGSVSPSTATGAIRYSGSQSALSFDGYEDGVSGPPFNVQNLTFETWLYPKSLTAPPGYSQIFNFVDRFAVFIYYNNAYLYIMGNSGWNVYSYNVGNTTNSWQHLAITYDDVAKEAKFYKNGIYKGNSTVGTTNIKTTTPVSNWRISGQGTQSYVYFGLLDELRVSNTIRYTSSFTPQTTPFVRDEFTKLLLHFDENGDDPRNSTKTFDDSGNNNHGTITAAKHVSGLVGVNTSTLDSGTLPSQSYASHQGIFMEEGTTNKITNPGFEHSTYDTSWSIGAGSTASIGTTAPYYKFGTKSLKLIATSNTDVTTSIDAGSTAVHTLSAYVFDATTGNVGGTISSSVAQLVFNGSAVGTTYTDTGGGWWRLNTSGAGNTLSQNFGIQVKSGKTIYVDGFQLEQKTYATSYADGNLGVGYSWTETQNESISSRTVGDLNYSATNNISNTQGSISFWMKIEKDTSSVKYFYLDPDPGCSYLSVYKTSSGTLCVYDGCSNTVCQSLSWATNSWKHLTIVWDTNYLNFYINGVGSTASSTFNQRTMSTIHVGSYNQHISDLRIFNDSLSDSEVTSLYYSGLGSHQTQSGFTDRFTDGQPPISYWKLDEGVGSTINDSISSNHGSLSTGDSSPTWVSGTSCISDNCLSFDGGDYASIPSAITGLKALSFWVKPTSSSSSIINLNGNQTINYSGGTISATNITSPTIYINGQLTTTLPQDTWSYVYITSFTSFATSNMTIGKVGTTYLNGFLDEIKVYSYQLDSDQIKNDYNLGYSASFGHQPETAQVTPLKSKLIAHYKFDEGYGATAHDSIGTNHGTFGTGSSAPTWTNNGKVGKAISFDGTNDKITVANFPFPDEQGSISVWAFIPSDTSPAHSTIARLDGANPWTYHIIQRLTNTNNVQYIFYNGTTGYSITSTVSTNQWHHFVATHDSIKNSLQLFVDGQNKGTSNYILPSTCNNKTLSFGSTPSGSNLFKGILDEVKVYNYALSLDEVKQDYNQGFSAVMGQSSSNTGSTAAPGSASQEYCIPGDTSPCSPPVAEWKFDEGVGTTAYDTSGNSYNGILINNPTWTIGKIGSSLKYNGQNNSVSLGASNNIINGNTWTVSSWFNASQVGSGTYIHRIITFMRTTGDSTGLSLITDLNDKIRLMYADAGGTHRYLEAGTINLNQWYHVSATYDGTTYTVYLNGTQTNQANDTFQGLSSGTARIGAYNASNYLFNGLIDNVLIYNYARTPAQIAWDYNRGKPIAHWKLDEIEGTTAHDSSGNNLHGTLGTGTSSPTWATGKLNNASSFDGNDFVSGNISNTNNTSFSISSWIKANIVNADQVIFSTNDLSINFQIQNPGNIRIQSNTGVSSPTCATSNSPIQSGQWYHVTGIFDQNNNRFQVYINGQLSAECSTTGTRTGNATTYYFSRQGDSAIRFFNGLIDDVRIYNYALTGDQIKTIYNNGSVSFN